MLILPYSPPPGAPRRRGFTLIELLVVIAIIAVLIGLLLPAVQKVRESASRTKCQNNMKQVALGIQLYHDTYKKLPTGLVTGNAATIGTRGWTWATIILPYIEQKGLYDQLGVDVLTPSYPPASPNLNLATKLTLYRCPSDTTADVNDKFASYGTSNYVCNREVFGPGRRVPAGAGVVQDSLTISTIKDGASNTIFVGEREGDPNVAAVWIHVGTAASGATPPYTASWEGRVGKGLNPDPGAGATWATSQAQSYAYSSNHTGGSQFAMGDGRVIFITNQVAALTTDAWDTYPCSTASGATLQLLQNPADRLPVSID